MSDQDKTLYSQGLNFESYISDSVDPRTGQFTCSIALFQVPAEARNCPPFNLTLAYNPLNPRNAGVGVGWTFNLSSYRHRLSSPTLYLSTGEHYQVRYLGGRLEIKDKKLESFDFRSKDNGDYEIIYKTGLVETLSNANNTYDTTVPLELKASSGQSLALGWTTLGGSTPLLRKVSHGSGTLLEIEYSGDRVLVTRAPNTADACTTTLVQKDGYLTQLLPPQEVMQQQWWFDYTAFAQTTCLTRVTNPVGLVNEVKYDPQGHKLPPGAPVDAVPYVTTHTVRPGNGQPDIVTYYDYSPKNFFGYEGVQNWEDGEDNLYRVSGEYHYKTTSTVGVSGPKMKYTYNKFHLLIENMREQRTTSVKQAVEYYASPTLPFELQLKKFQLPKITTTTYEDYGGSQTASRTETTEHDYDDWGNPISETDKSGVRTEREFYPPGGETGKNSFCPADPFGFSRYIKNETVYPSKKEGLLPAPTHRQHYNYLQLPTVTGAGYFVAVEELHLQDMTKNEDLVSTNYGYYKDASLNPRNYGRMMNQTTSLAGQAPVKKEWSYNYADTGEKVTIVTKITTFDKQTTKQDVTDSLWSGNVLGQTNAQGVQERFDYDKMDRLVKATLSPGTPYEATKRYRYAIVESGAGSYMVVTDVKGLETRKMMDGLGRVYQVSKQDGGGGTLRVVEERGYNELGQCVEVDSVDWSNGGATEYRSKTSTVYDDWGQVFKTTKSSGAEILSAFVSNTNPVDLTLTEGIEGQGQTKTWSNLFGSADRVELLKKDQGSGHQPYSKTIYAHDGLGRLAKETDNSGHTTQYQLDDYGRTTQTRFPDGRIIEAVYASHTTHALPVSMKVRDAAQQRLMGKRSVDGLDRVLGQTVGGRTTTQTYDGIGPDPSTMTTPVGDTSRLSYNVALGNKLTRRDSPGKVSSYGYDAQRASLLHIDCADSTEDYQYLLSGPLKGETIKISGIADKLSTESTHSLAGRLLSYTNIHGQEQSRAYDGFGRLVELRQGAVKARFEYDGSSRLSCSSVVDEATAKTVTMQRGYDDFGREITRTVSQGTGSTGYQLSQTFNELGSVTRRLVKDGRGTLLRDESFTYDGCSRLLSYQCTGSQPPSDEMGKPVKQQNFVFDVYDNIAQMSTTFQDGTKNRRSYVFSNDDPTQLVRVTNTDPDYPAQVDLSYDESGRLVRDERGRELTYDSQNALVSVSDGADKTVLSKYRYDAKGRLICQEAAGKKTYFFYQNDALVAMVRDESKISFISDGSQYWGQMSRGEDGDTAVQLWATDEHQSVLWWSDTARSTDMHSQQYTPYGFGTASSAVGFNGQYRDPVTGWYHLGHGYRVYNPVLMRFHTPEPLSPFSTGEINPYAYCRGDPINRTDPTGHMSGRDWAVMGVGLFVGILVGIFTAGAGFAVAAAVSVAAGAAADMVTGAVYDAASGKTPTLESVGMDALFGAVGGLVGEGVGRGLAAGVKALSRGVSRLGALARGLRGGRVPLILEGAEQLPRAVQDVRVPELQARIPPQREVLLGTNNPGLARGGPRPHPGPNIRSRVEYGVHMREEMEDFDNMFQTIMGYRNGTSPLQNVVADVAYSAGPHGDQDIAQLWYMSSWHTSRSDPLEHATFRLYRLDDTFHFTNVENYHLYRDGRSTARLSPGTRNLYY